MPEDNRRQSVEEMGLRPGRCLSVDHGRLCSAAMGGIEQPDLLVCYVDSVSLLEQRIHCESHPINGTALTGGQEAIVGKGRLRLAD